MHKNMSYGTKRLPPIKLFELCIEWYLALPRNAILLNEHVCHDTCQNMHNKLYHTLKSSLTKQLQNIAITL